MIGAGFAAAATGVQFKGILALSVFTLLSVGTVGVMHLRLEHDRDQLLAWSDRSCEATGILFRPDGEKKKTRGVACQAEIRRLVKLEKDLAKASLEDLVIEFERREGRAAVDAGLATLYRERMAAAEAAYREAEDGVKGDQVGRDWACAVNKLGGMRGRGC